MKTMRSIDLQPWRWLFIVAAVYDIALGVAFFVAWEPLLEWIGMTPPPHAAYVHLAAVFVTVQGISYLFAAADLLGNLGLVRVGVIYKAGYSVLAAYYLLTNQMPAVFFTWFGLFDLLFLVAFAWFLWRVRAEPASGR